MAEFTIEYLQTLKQSFPHDMDLLNSLTPFHDDHHQSCLNNSTNIEPTNNNNNNMALSSNNHPFLHLPPMNFDNDLSNSMDPNNDPPPPPPVVYDHFFPHGGACSSSHVIPANKNTSDDHEASKSEFFVNPSSSFSEKDLAGANKKNGNEKQSGKKRKRNGDRKLEKPREVIHVRAKRGQATDSHSLAERLRRQKINEKFRCLQDLVPGCYKTMGMAVMLDVIINYVRSLQNQIDFLSMKLSAASLFHDFNSPDHVDAMGGMQVLPQGMNAYEANAMERIQGEGYGGFPQFQSTLPL